MKYGTVTVGFGSPEQHDIEVQDFVKSVFAGDRFVHVSKLVDGTYCISVENLPSSGRAPQQSMRLSEESFGALMYSCMLYMQVKGMNVETLMTDLQRGSDGNIQYSVSDNLKPISSDPTQR